MRDAISAKFLLAAPPPDHVELRDEWITRLPARVAYGARKPRGNCLGGAQTTSAISQSADRRIIRGLAARGY